MTGLPFTEINRMKANMKTELQTGRVMREARLRLRITQFTLSRRVGCSESQITKIETGRTEPAQWLKEAIARELNIHSWEVGV
jgi:DNA-binding XRE family transcriptional regulator